jgi:hypothetical protein
MKSGLTFEHLDLQYWVRAMRTPALQSLCTREGGPLMG